MSLPNDCCCCCTIYLKVQEHSNYQKKAYKKKTKPQILCHYTCDSSLINKAFGCPANSEELAILQNLVYIC